MRILFEQTEVYVTNLDLYRIMQVHPSSDQDMIVFAYKKLSKKYHPDLNQVPLKHIQDLNYAYEILIDSSMRADYDRNYFRQSFKTTSYEKEQILQAQKVIENYFKYLTTDNYVKAYDLISFADRQRISFDVFKEWQSVVTKFYKINDYQIDFVDSYYNMSVDQKRFSHVTEYHVSVYEKDLASRKEQIETMNKLVLKENNDWKVFLGYKKLETYTAKLKLFKELPNQNIDLKNNKNHDFFLKLIEKENYRKQRYNRDYVLLMFEIRNYEQLYDQIDENLKNYLISVFGGLKFTYRFLDEFSRYEEDKFFLLLPETSVEESKTVVEKTLDYFKHQKPFPLFLNYVSLSNLSFSANQMIHIAVSEMMEKNACK